MRDIIIAAYQLHIQGFIETFLHVKEERLLKGGATDILGLTTFFRERRENKTAGRAYNKRRPSENALRDP